MHTGDNMVSFIFVHGGNISTEAWNERTTGDPVHTSDGLMGGRIWDTALSALADQGIQGYAPTLGDEKISNLTDHITQICSLVHEHDLDTIILVGHSYGGMIITGVAARMPEKISHLVYIDAAYPESGQSLYDMMLSGGQDPSSYAGFVPDPPYVENCI